MVTFPLMSKISVKGSDMHPIYQFLTQAKKMGLRTQKYHGISKVSYWKRW